MSLEIHLCHGLSDPRTERLLCVAGQQHRKAVKGEHRNILDHTARDAIHRSEISIGRLATLYDSPRHLTFPIERSTNPTAAM